MQTSTGIYLLQAKRKVAANAFTWQADPQFTHFFGKTAIGEERSLLDSNIAGAAFVKNGKRTQLWIPRLVGIKLISCYGTAIRLLT